MQDAARTPPTASPTALIRSPEAAALHSVLERDVELEANKWTGGRGLGGVGQGKRLDFTAIAAADSEDDCSEEED